jgi:hypothetical protein
MLNALWDNPEALARTAKVAPYVFIVLGFIVALAGQYVRSTLDARVQQLKVAAEAARKRTPPELDAYLAFGEKSRELLVIIDAKNEIPFKARWILTTANNVSIAGVPLEDVEIHPTNERRRWNSKANIQTDRLVNDYVELRFSYESLYSAELGGPDNLRGEIIRRYRLIDGKPYRLD